MVELAPFDVIDAANFTVYLHAYRAARSIGAAAVATWHEVWLGQWVRHKGFITGSLGAMWERAAIRRPWDAIIAVSRFTADRLVARGVPPRRVYVVHNGIDPSQASAALAKPVSPRESFDLITVGRIIESKRLDTLVDAVALLAARRPPWFHRLRCHIIGEGEARPQVERRLANRGVAGRFVFHGRLAAHAEVLRRIAAASLLVQSSAVEGFGMVLVEANAVGTPFIASDIGPHREVCGLLGGNALFPLGEARALADAIERHLSLQPVSCGDPGALGWGPLSNQVEQVYRSAMDAKARE